MAVGVTEGDGVIHQEGANNESEHAHGGQVQVKAARHDASVGHGREVDVIQVIGKSFFE